MAFQWVSGDLPNLTLCIHLSSEAITIFTLRPAEISLKSWACVRPITRYGPKSPTLGRRKSPHPHGWREVAKIASAIPVSGGAIGTGRDQVERTMTDPASSATSGFIRMRGLTRRIPVARSTILDWVRRGSFPRPVKLSTSVTAWRLSDIAAWEATRPRAIAVESCANG